ncbi:MAG: hypothetical protein IT523_12380 [Burkholderiales bacterium]|nr:hypothetical protein [Burkholderiales bacterium]
MNRNLIRFLGVCAGLLIAATADAQPATGQSATNCQQTGNQLVCTTTTTLTLPAGTNLNGMSLPAANGGPCSPTMIVAPQTIPYDTPTTISLAVTGCPSSGYTFNWAPPVTSNATTAQIPVTLTSTRPAQNFTVNVCPATNQATCQTITGAVSATTTTGPSVAPLTGCTISPTSPSVIVGGSLTLTASCTTGTAAGSGATYQWTRNGTNIPGATAANYVLTATDVATPGAYNFGVSISNAAPSNQSPTTTVTVAPASNANDSCPAYPVRLTINASEPNRTIYTSQVTPNFTAGDDFVIQINVTANDTTIGRALAGISFSDFGANRGGRWATVSQNKCDYTDNAQWITTNFLGEKYPENAGSATVTLGADTRPTPVHLTPGVWYLNIKNVVGSCPSNQSCHSVIQWSN